MSTVQMEIVTGPAPSPRNAARHVHSIAFVYGPWLGESYGCRGVWRNANLSQPLAQTAEVYATETEAVAAAAQAFLDALKNRAAVVEADGA